MAKKEYTTVEAAGREVRISSPSKVYFPKGRSGKGAITKLDLVEYYLAVEEAAVNQLRERPGTMKRFIDGVTGEFFFQKRVPKNAPEWLETATFTFPSGRTATELVANDGAHLAWAVNLGVIDFNPHPVRRSDLDNPDELRVDLDPQPGVRWNTVRKVAMCAKEVLEDHGLVGYPKTSGNRGIHVNVRIEPRWDYVEVRRAALALAREVERRLPKNATSKWWKEERHGVFVDYNQNARDRTIASGYSVRPVPEAKVCCPLTLGRGPRRRGRRPAARHGAGPDREARRPRGRHRRQRRAPSTSSSTSPAATRRRASATPRGRPTSRKQKGEPKRVQPSKAKKKARARRARAASPSGRRGRARRAAPGSSRACWPARAARRPRARAGRPRCR